MSYQAYWRSVIIEYMDKVEDKQITIRGISRVTGMCPHDIAATLQALGMVAVREGK